MSRTRTLPARAGLVMFDFDGTLADTVGGICETVGTVLLDHGLAADELGDLTRLVGPPFPQAFSDVYGMGADEAAEVTAEFRARYLAGGPRLWPLYDGVAQLVADLVASGRTCAVASSKQTRFLRSAVADVGLDGLLSAVEGKLGDHEADKAGTIARVLDELGFDASDAVMVGDRGSDVEAAAANGVACVGVLHGRTCPESELVSAGACAVTHTVAELRRALLGDAPAGGAGPSAEARV